MSMYNAYQSVQEGYYTDQRRQRIREIVDTSRTHSIKRYHKQESFRAELDVVVESLKKSPKSIR